MKRQRLEDNNNVERHRLDDNAIAGNKIKTDHIETKFSCAKTKDRKITVEPEEEEREQMTVNL